MMAKAGWIAAAVALVLVGAAACRESRPLADERAYRAAHGTGDILIGAGWPWAARTTLLYGQGVDLAVDEINRAGGVNGRQLRIVREDDQESVDEGRLVAQRFASNPDIVAVIGHLHSYVTNPAAAIYDAAGLPMIAPASTDPDLTRRGFTRTFRAIFTDSDVGRQMAQFAVGRGYQRFGIFYVRTAYGRGLANAFEETAMQLGARILDRQSYDPNETSSVRVVDNVLDEWKARDLSAIFIAGQAAESALFIARARALGMPTPVFAGDAAGTPELFGRGRAAVEGTIVASAFHPKDRRPEVSQFVLAFEQRYHTLPDAAAALGYDAVRLVARAIADAGSAAPDRVVAALRAADGWRGVTGPFRFDDQGDPIDRPLVLMVAHDGAFDFLTDAASLAGKRVAHHAQ